MNREKRYWKQIPGHAECYASNTGEVMKDRKILKQTLRGGYYAVSVGKTMSVHRLVAMAWHPNTNNHPVVNHKNLTKTDNRPINLEWCTYKENANHAVRNGIEIRHFTPIQMYEAILEKVPEHRQVGNSKNGKKSYTRVFYITKAKKGKLIKEFDSVTEGLKYVNALLKKDGKPLIKRHTISKVLVGENNIGGGYIWKYKKDRRIEIPETARTITQYPNYKCDPQGNIYRTDKRWLIKPMISGHGALHVTISKKRDGSSANKYIHRLVAKLFLPNPENKQRVHHIDRDLTNNNVENLKWVA